MIDSFMLKFGEEMAHMTDLITSDKSTLWGMPLKL